ncbi:hypothetical protein [Lysobacter enzymogenes]|uniref:hypothetical protein n=1 Tax=Lysobacter enzymogenes TaxID=69 RepID=UPI001A95C7D3|nr:hypothetical protein [Lysobacter enzymogenes]QQP96616.1 hypothetical protein JHW38_00730 [Lysobacter enzymogenes]
MTIQREAAYHEAAHAVLAHKSKYHAIVGEINLLDYGAGELYLSLSRSKCARGGKPQDPSAQRDKDVAQDFAVVLCAGLAGEIIASEHDKTLTPNPVAAEPDYDIMKLQLQKAGLSKKHDLYEKQAHELLKENWKAVDNLAKYLFTKQSAQPLEIIEIIERACQAP